MKCENCHTNEATIHFAVCIGLDVDDIVERGHYCVECADSGGILWSGILFRPKNKVDKTKQWNVYISKVAARMSKMTVSRPHSVSHQEKLAIGSTGKAQQDARKSIPPVGMAETAAGLEAKMAKAVKEERYEEAAKIRDMIVKMKNPVEPFK
jgi:protein-arginine kinase activator protein McsA